MLNLTPHAITITTEFGSVTFPPSGTVARVSTIERNVQLPLDLGNDLMCPVISRQFGEVTGLPQEGTPCIVSALVLGACSGRKGVYAPDTGPTALRDENGLVKAVTRLVAA